jgi:putative transposase
VTRFRFVSDHAEKYGVKRMCTVLKVSRSGYYDWSRRPPSAHARRDAELKTLVCEIHQRSRTTYGAPRVHAELRRLDQRCGKKRVARLMATNHLVGAHARRKWRRGRPDVAPDLVNRDFTASRPDEIWAADVTQFWTAEGWLYFAGVIDLYSRRVVGWSMSGSPDADLVIDALLMGFQRRRPDQKLIHHSDRGAVGGISRSSQHLNHGGVRWDAAGSSCWRCRRVPGGSGRRTGPCALRCVPPGGRSRRVRCSGSSGG